MFSALSLLAGVPDFSASLIVIFAFSVGTEDFAGSELDSLSEAFVASCSSLASRAAAGSRGTILFGIILFFGMRGGSRSSSSGSGL